MYGSFPNGHYISPDNGKTVYLVEDLFTELPTSMHRWLAPDLTNVKAPDVQTITLSGPDKKDIELIRIKEDGPLEVKKLSRKEESNSSNIKTLETSLSWLALDDVVDPALSDEELGLNNPDIFNVTTKQGMLYTVKIGAFADEKKTARYARINVSLLEDPSATTPGTEEEINEREELQAEANALNAKLGGFTYTISSHKLNPMTFDRDKLVKKKEKKKED
jgi:hypothetical protein